MGNEIGRRHGNFSEYATPHIMNNMNPLKFHSVHGENIHLSKNDTVAAREGGFCKAIAFSQRPVAVNENIYIRFLDVQTCWSGTLRIGFTSNDPVVYRNKLPKYSCPCMTEMPGNWARALTEQHTTTNSVLFYYVDVNGDVHYGFDQEESGFLFGGVDTSGKLWAMLDVYGNAVKIEFLDPRQIRNSVIPLPGRLAEQQNVSPPHRASASKYFNHSIVNFHLSHGDDVFVYGNRAVLKNLPEASKCGYVFVDRSIRVNECLVLKLLQCSTVIKTGMIIGVTTCCPSVFTSEQFPEDPYDLLDRSEYWVVQKCEQVSQSDVLAFVLERDGALKYSQNNGEFLLLCFVDPLAKMWFFVNLGGSVIEIELKGIYQKSEENVPLSSAHQCNNALSIGTQEGNSAEHPQTSNTSECVICCEKTANCALYRCGHVCMCYECAMQVKDRDSQCPLCRGIILDVLQIFI